MQNIENFYMTDEGSHRFSRCWIEERVAGGGNEANCFIETFSPKNDFERQ